MRGAGGRVTALTHSRAPGAQGGRTVPPISTPHLHTSAPHFAGAEVCRTLPSPSPEGATNLSETRGEPGGPGV